MGGASVGVVLCMHGTLRLVCGALVCLWELCAEAACVGRLYAGPISTRVSARGAIHKLCHIVVLCILLPIPPHLQTYSDLLHDVAVMVFDDPFPPRLLNMSSGFTFT